MPTRCWTRGPTSPPRPPRSGRPSPTWRQFALELLYTGRRITGEEARAVGLCDRLADLEGLRPAARALAAEIAGSAPLAVRSIRTTMRGHLADEVARITRHEDAAQKALRATADFAEGTRASLERRPPDFTGR